MSKSISVIMSAYNTEAYIDRCLKSVLQQSFTDLELIIVNNGSTDRTGAILREYAQQDGRITIVELEQNIAPNSALNMAMDRATGEYLCVIDSDDWIEQDMLYSLYSRASSRKAQLTYCGFYMDYLINDKMYSVDVSLTDADYTQQGFRRHAVEDITRMILTVYWNKLIRLDYIRSQGIRFRHTKMFDHHFNMDIILNVDIVSVVGKPLYHYIRSREGSYMGSNPNLNRKKREHFAHTMAVYEYWGTIEQETVEKLAGYHLAQQFRCVVDTVNGNYTKSYKKSELNTIFTDQWTEFSIANRPKSLQSTIFAFVLRCKNYMLCRVIGLLVRSAQKYAPRAYYTMRAAVAQKGNNNES